MGAQKSAASGGPESETKRSGHRRRRGRDAVGESGATQCNAIPKRAPEIAEQEAAPGTRDSSESATQRVDAQRRPKKSEDDKGRASGIKPDSVQLLKMKFNGDPRVRSSERKHFIRSGSESGEERHRPTSRVQKD